MAPARHENVSAGSLTPTALGPDSMAPPGAGKLVERASIDARALSSLVAVLLALSLTAVIGIAGRALHGGSANATSRDAAKSAYAPLLNYGVPAPTPAFNVSRSFIATQASSSTDSDDRGETDDSANSE